MALILGALSHVIDFKISKFFQTFSLGGSSFVSSFRCTGYPGQGAHRCTIYLKQLGFRVLGGVMRQGQGAV